MCETYTAPPLPEYLDFLYNDFDSCIELNAVKCAHWDDWCVDSLKYMENRKTALDKTVDTINCKKCDIEIM